MNTIDLILEYHQAYEQQQHMEQALETFVNALSGENSAYIIDNPFEAVLAKLIADMDQDLWNWYTWRTFEDGSTYTVDDVEYNAQLQSLQEFLETVSNTVAE